MRNLDASMASLSSRQNSGLAARLVSSRNTCTERMRQIAGDAMQATLDRPGGLKVFVTIRKERVERPRHRCRAHPAHRGTVARCRLTRRRLRPSVPRRSPGARSILRPSTANVHRHDGGANQILATGLKTCTDSDPNPAPARRSQPEASQSDAGGTGCRLQVVRERGGRLPRSVRPHSSSMRRSRTAMRAREQQAHRPRSLVVFGAERRLWSHPHGSRLSQNAWPERGEAPPPRCRSGALNHRSVRRGEDIEGAPTSDTPVSDNPATEAFSSLAVRYRRFPSTPTRRG